ncbi:hypothetical protein JJD66_27500 [Pseudomonas sp. MF6751]|uniref:hypothetical protein n=1 Tax=Pseudomonas TaxID=286 RepID=UPI0015E41FE9|nr:MULTISPECIES: hypothetical protein [Pseudomonas]MBA1301378.1 hypothetical protein [Pseudomonas carnis]MBJ2203958.1 hypothetical protein [Pseudomonas carnis]MBK3479832.1 hypothetical protein [Pseudomonas sp. MF6751]
MSHNFKPGDLALIINSHKRPENVGKSCELVAFMAPGDRIEFEFDGNKAISHIGANPAWLVAGKDVVGSNGKAGFALVRPQNLMPLRGDFAPEQQKAKEAV